MDSNLDQIQLPQLNLPHFEPQLLKKDGKLWIFDTLRKKQLVLTPEEWVRQHWINFLSIQLKFPKGLFALEKGLMYNQLLKRTDLVVWDKNGKPYLLIECKAPKVKLTQKTIEQACMYHKELKSPFLIISNGLQHICLSFDPKVEKFTQEKSFPEPPI
ncbi:type I restriction enzyme HsdR N-terminal domain-containing protein [Algoriphagus halophytocola]|uniref:Type I restriction enzyme HsdR N-terminal domain-containing protein n=1 Tax=Algoriphagus halophytocola TaxID=2991499 RepID=A0ABY6MGF2_9BACT|nr:MULTISPECIES: type I restriction enzyme HsdR N-terminal domain-containing protein [unclassified Algoriphagus]UZD22713.1 type I restriction enzyme HsdR N-terminal domain-containing protein [Algoriphagus sp. TR-M5]WBL43978.1 type I restriction enzyme HsdR N-terminal domain-containing protein [Algoriphagus sp. TR-M9]